MPPQDRNDREIRIVEKLSRAAFADLRGSCAGAVRDPVRRGIERRDFDYFRKRAVMKRTVCVAT